MGLGSFKMDPENKRIVVTGLGVISPIGIGNDEFWRSLAAGASGIKRITSFDATPFTCTVAGEVTDFNPLDFIDPKKARRLDRFVQLALSAVKLAVADAGLAVESIRKDRVGVAAGTATAGQGWAFQQYEIFREKGYKRLNPFTAASTFPNACSSAISIELNVTGPSATFSSGCVSGAEAIGYAISLIKSGRVDAMIVCASEALLYPPIFGSYCASNLLTKANGIPSTTPRPFDKTRDGIALSEGAGAMILETAKAARQRGARIYAEIPGYGETCDAFHPIAEEPSGIQPAEAMRLALLDAGVSVEDVDYIKLHGTGDPVGDIIETRALKSLFGKRSYDIPMSSIKSMIGHSQGACGIIELVAATRALREDLIPPTINYKEPDPECDLNYCPNVSVKAKIKIALANTFGFGGKNVAIVISEPR